MGQINPAWLDATLAYARDSALTGQAADLYRSAMLLRTVSDVAMQAAMAPPAMIFDAAPFAAAPPPFGAASPFGAPLYDAPTVEPPPPASPLLELLSTVFGAGGASGAATAATGDDPRRQITAALLRLVMERVLSNLRR